VGMDGTKIPPRSQLPRSYHLDLGLEVVGDGFWEGGLIRLLHVIRVIDTGERDSVDMNRDVGDHTRIQGCVNVCVRESICKSLGCLCWYVGVVDVVTTRPCRGPERYACLAYYLLMYLFSHVSSEPLGTRDIESRSAV